MKTFWTKLKLRFNIESDFQAILVLFIFSIAGSSILFVKQPIFHFIHYDEIHNTFLKVVVYIAFIIPTYYLMLFIWANVLGQGKIFNPMIRKMLKRYVSIFKFKKQSDKE